LQEKKTSQPGREEKTRGKKQKNDVKSDQGQRQKKRKGKETLLSKESCYGAGEGNVEREEGKTSTFLDARIRLFAGKVRKRVNLITILR